MVRRLRLIGWGQTPSVLVAVLAFSVLVSATAGVLGTQVLHMAASLPHYERTIQKKLHDLDEMTVGRLDAQPVGLPKATLIVLDSPQTLR